MDKGLAGNISILIVLMEPREKSVRPTMYAFYGPYYIAYCSSINDFSSISKANHMVPLSTVGNLPDFGTYFSNTSDEHKNFSFVRTKPVRSKNKVVEKAGWTYFGLW